MIILVEFFFFTSEDTRFEQGHDQAFSVGDIDTAEVPLWDDNRQRRNRT